MNAIYKNFVYTINDTIGDQIQLLDWRDIPILVKLSDPDLQIDPTDDELIGKKFAGYDLPEIAPPVTQPLVPPVAFADGHQIGLAVIDPRNQAILRKYKIEKLHHAGNAIVNLLAVVNVCLQDKMTPQAHEALMDSIRLADIIVRSHHALNPIGEQVLLDPAGKVVTT